MFTLLNIVLIRIQFNLLKSKITTSQENMNPSGRPSNVERFTSMFDNFNLPTKGVGGSAPVRDVTTLDGATVSAPTDQEQNRKL